MPRAIIEDWDQFAAFLSAQPLCMWSAEKARDLAAGKPAGHATHHAHEKKKDDNAELMAALSSMA